MLTEASVMASNAESLSTAPAPGVSAPDLRDRVEHCRTLLAKMSAEEYGVGTDAREQLARLNIWVSNMGVFAEGRKSLAARLKDTDEAGKLILRLLLALESELEEAVKQLQGTGVQEGDENHSDAEGDGSDYVSECSSTSSYRIAGPAAGAEITDASIPQPKLRTSIQSTLTRLHQLALIVREAGRQHRRERIERFRTLDRNKEVYELFERCARQKSDHLFPKASTALRERVAQSIAMRRARFSYLSQHQQKISTLSKPAPDSLETRAEKAEDATPVPQSDRKLAAGSAIQTAHGRRAGGAPSRMLSNTVDTRLDTERLHRVEPNRPESVASVQISASEYPKRPRLSTVDNTFTCPYCCLVYPANEAATEKQWTQHLMHDFEPFFCVDDSCSSPFSCAESYSGWLAHMRTEHSQENWQCWHCRPRGEGPVLFPTAQSLEEHMRGEHKDDIKESLYATILRHSMVQEPRIFQNGCPFCGGNPEELERAFPDQQGREADEALEKHVRDHLIALALVLAPIDTGERDEELKDDKSNAQRDDNSVLRSEGPVVMPSSFCSQETCDCKDKAKDSWARDILVDSSVSTLDTPEGDPSYHPNADSKLEWEFCLAEYPGNAKDERLLQYFGTRAQQDDPDTAGLSSSGSSSYSNRPEPLRPSQDCLRSLAFPRMHNRSHDIGSAVTGTCEWLFRHETYRSWAACDRGLLWIIGKPGSGKSTLLKHAINNRTEAPGAKDNDLILSFFFYDCGDELQRTPFGLFRSLLYQVLSQVPDALPNLIDTFEKNRNEIGQPGEKWHWHQEQLQRFFEQSLPKILKTRPVWLFVDALDECGKDNAVALINQFNSLLHGLPVAASFRRFHICFSCRPYPIVERGHQKNLLEINLEKENNSDIKVYVNRMLSNLQDQTQQPTVQELIATRANGVFMWARLVVEKVQELESQGYSEKKLRNSINNTPKKLEDVYHQLAKNMGPHSIKLIQWICFAVRPLTLDELRWAIIIDPNDQRRSLRKYQEDDDYIENADEMTLQLRELSCGLAEIVPSSDAQIVQFIHQSVGDYFVDKGLPAFGNSSGSTDTAIGMAHHRLSKICIRYLAIREIGQLTSYKRHDFPFLHYATTSWVAHAKQSDSRNVRQKDLLECFAWPSNALVDLWVRVYRTLPQYSPDRPAEGTTLVHVLSKYGTVKALEVILQKADHTIINTKDGNGRTPLSYAAENGNGAVKLLLTTGKVKIDEKDMYGRTPLSYAAGAGHEAVVKQLLATKKVVPGFKIFEQLLGKIDVNSEDNNGRTPLSWAALNGHESVVEQLLATDKVNVDLKDEWGQTPLLWAIQNGHKAVVKQLLATGKVGVNSKDSGGRTPLSWAAGSGHEAVVKQLLATGKVDVDSKDSGGRTPLTWAALSGHETVVKQLLATSKVDVDSKDSDGRTPLSWAVKYGREAVVKQLLATGKVDVDSKDSNWGRTPLSWAAGNGHEAVVKQLLVTGKADIDSKDAEYGRTPLSWAAESGHEAVVRQLLATGKVDVDSKDIKGQTPLSLAARNGHAAIAKLFE